MIGAEQLVVLCPCEAGLCSMFARASASYLGQESQCTRLSMQFGTMVTLALGKNRLLSFSDPSKAQTAARC